MRDEYPQEIFDKELPQEMWYPQKIFDNFTTRDER